MTVNVDEADRQMIVLAIAQLSLDRPGWEFTLRRMARIALNGEQMFDEFRRLNADKTVRAMLLREFPFLGTETTFTDLSAHQTATALLQFFKRLPLP